MTSSKIGNEKCFCAESAGSAPVRSSAKQLRCPFVFPSGVDVTEIKEGGRRIEVKPLKFARTVAPVCNCQTNGGDM